MKCRIACNNQWTLHAGLCRFSHDLSLSLSPFFFFSIWPQQLSVFQHYSFGRLSMYWYLEILEIRQNTKNWNYKIGRNNTFCKFKCTLCSTVRVRWKMAFWNLESFTPFVTNGSLSMERRVTHSFSAPLFSLDNVNSHYLNPPFSKPTPRHRIFSILIWHIVHARLLASLRGTKFMTFKLVSPVSFIRLRCTVLRFQPYYKLFQFLCMSCIFSITCPNMAIFSVACPNIVIFLMHHWILIFSEHMETFFLIMCLNIANIAILNRVSKYLNLLLNRVPKDTFVWVTYLNVGILKRVPDHLNCIDRMPDWICSNLASQFHSSLVIESSKSMPFVINSSHIVFADYKKIGNLEFGLQHF